MSLYGYSDALSQGANFNARVNNFNEGVMRHNQKLQADYDTKVKAQPGKVSDDKLKQEEDEAFYGAKDGTGLLSSGAGVGQATMSIAKKGFGGYVSGEMSERANNIKNTARALVHGEPKPEPQPKSFEMGEVDQDGKVTTSLVDAEKAGQEAENAANLAGDGAKVASQTAERESSGLMTLGIKKGLKLATQGKIGDAGLSALSEVGGKVIGDFSGAIDVGKNIKNLVDGKNIFSGEDTADKFQEAGAVLDVAGIAFPPAEVVGGVLNLVGGAIDAWKDISNDMDKKTDDSVAPPPPKKTAVKVTPAFQSMGLVASQLPSAKNQIVGSSTF
jgi:hypothetical protein